MLREHATNDKHLQALDEYEPEPGAVTLKEAEMRRMTPPTPRTGKRHGRRHARWLRRLGHDDGVERKPIVRHPLAPPQHLRLSIARRV